MDVSRSREKHVTTQGPLWDHAEQLRASYKQSSRYLFWSRLRWSKIALYHVKVTLILRNQALGPDVQVKGPMSRLRSLPACSRVQWWAPGILIGQKPPDSRK